MSIHFTELYVLEGAALYVQEKLRAIPQLTTTERQRSAAIIAHERRLNPERLPLADPETLPGYSDKHMEYARAVVEMRSPLLRGETLTAEDSLGALSEDYHNVPAGTIVLTRTTSHAKLNYYFIGAFVEDGKIFRPKATLPADTTPGAELPRLTVAKPDGVLASEHIPAKYLTASLAVGGAFDWGSVALKFATGLAGGIGGKVGTMIFDAIFAAMGFSQVPGWFGEVFEEFTRIIYEALDKDWMRKLEADMKSVASMVTQYNNTRELFMLRTAWENSVHLTNDMMQLGITATANFMIGASLHLSILQQLAMVADNPETKKGYEKTIKEQAGEFATWAVDKRDTLKKNRLAAITQVEFHRPLNPNVVPFYWWKDEDTGLYKSYATGICCHPQEEAQKERDAHYNKIEKEITAKLQPIVDSANEWKKLIKNPLPPK